MFKGGRGVWANVWLEACQWPAGHAAKEQPEAGQRWTKQRQIETNACGKSFAAWEAKTRVQLAGHHERNNPLSCHPKTFAVQFEKETAKEIPRTYTHTRE